MNMKTTYSQQIKAIAKARDAGSTIASLNLTKNVPSLPMEYRGYTIQMDSRDYGPTEFMFYPTEEGISHDADCTDGESFTYCGNCKWASDLESAQYEIDDLVIEALNDRAEELEKALQGVLNLKPILGADEEYYNMPEHQGEGEAVYKMFQTIEQLLNGK